MSHSPRRPAASPALRCRSYRLRRSFQAALLLSLIFLAAGCASKSSPPVAKPAYEGSSKVVTSARVVKSSKGSQVVSTARSLIGTPYKWGGRSPKTGFDCSGFVGYVYKRYGIDLPRTSSAMRSVGRSVDRDNLRAGDIVIYNISKKGKSLHVGIATGKGTFVHAPSSGKGVSESSMSIDYWKKHFLDARRVF